MDRQWIRNLYGFAIAPHLVFYLKLDEKTLIRRILQSRGMDYWESGWTSSWGTTSTSFRAYQRVLLREYASMADEFGFRMLDARRRIDVIQDELRRQIGAFLAESDGVAAARSRGKGTAAVGRTKWGRRFPGLGNRGCPRLALLSFTRNLPGEIRGKRPADSVVGLA